MFQPQLWGKRKVFKTSKFDKDGVPQDVKEVWFSGVHGDIGGGYPEQQSGLAKIPLSWMLREVKATGLHIIDSLVDRIVLGKDSSGKYSEPAPSDNPHNSMSLGWSILEFIPRKKPPLSGWFSVFGLTIPLFSPRKIPSGSLVHKSVQQANTTPGNLPEDYETVD